MFDYGFKNMNCVKRLIDSTLEKLKISNSKIFVIRDLITNENMYCGCDFYKLILEVYCCSNNNNLLFLETFCEKRLFIVPDNIPKISVEDKLKYNLPNDIIVTHHGSKTPLSNCLVFEYDNIKEIDLQHQINMIRKYYHKCLIELEDY